MSFVIFFLVVFIVNTAVNFYIAVRGWDLFPPDSGWRWVYLAVLLILSLSFLGGRFLERVWLSPVSEALVWIGSYWLAAMLYFFLIVLAIDLVRLANHFVPFISAHVLEVLRRERLPIGGGIVFAVGLVILVGHMNAAHPRVRTLDLRLTKNFTGMDSMVVVMASDIHLGTIIGRRQFDGIVETINGLKPDLILLPGDIVDEDLAPVIRENLGDNLRALKARFGVVAATGNHEYIGGVEAATAYLREHGITVLRDSALQLPNGMQIIGREDRSIRQFAGKARKSLAELLSMVDRSRPIILMDHQPFGLHEAVEAGIDLQLSGHTHHGQIWPFNYLTNAIYELSWGYRQIGPTHIYVSSGVGTWGPPVRLGNRPEIVQIRLRWVN